MNHHRIISHKDTKEFGKVLSKLTLKRIILFNIIILTIGITASIVMINPIPIIIVGIVAYKLGYRKKGVTK